MKKVIVSLIITINALSVSSLHSQAKELWGMTSHGGGYGCGTIYKTDIEGNNHEVKYSFESESPGGRPRHTKLCEASNGKLYGLTTGGGQCSGGVIFEYNPLNDTYTKKIDFNNSKGNNPNGSLIKATNGKMYGMTRSGGVNNRGVIFEYNAETNEYIKKIDLDMGIGGNPEGSLYEASNGKLYGMTFYGGRNGYGTIIEYNPIDNTINKLFDFSDSDGKSPMGNVIEVETGLLYGMTWRGGNNNLGAFFTYNYNTGVYEKIVDFDGTNGSSPQSSLSLSEGIIYGTTLVGGNSGNGVLFKYDPSNSTYTKLIDFSSRYDGSQPVGAVLEASNGKLYGLTTYGGSHGHGTLYEYDKVRNIFTSKKSFDLETIGGISYGSLVEASNGKFYGITYSGGENDEGILFEYDVSSNKLDRKISFNKSISGSSPKGSLLSASNGKFYGLTYSGGIYGGGTLFEYDTKLETYFKKYDFGSWLDHSELGCNPYGSLIECSDGFLYGVTSSGGTAQYQKGTIFKYDMNTSTLEKVFDMGVDDGAQAMGDLVEANGKLYGITNDGGDSGKGVLFEFDPQTKNYTKKLDFSGSKGASPKGSLIKISTGELVGMTHDGGNNGSGVLFKFNPNTDEYSKLFDFSSNTARWINGNVVEADNGKLYGMSRIGGNYSDGVIFEFNLETNEYTTMHHFCDCNGGANPLGSLMNASNGKLYGMTTGGGESDLGVIVEYDIESKILTNKTDFIGINGANNWYSGLIEVSKSISTDVKENPINLMSIYPNPSNGIVNINKNIVGDCSFKIYDIYGKVIMSDILIAPMTKVDLNGYPIGIYYVVFSSDFEIKPIKILLY